MSERCEALVLKTELSGESFIKLYLLTVEHGIFLCLKRSSKKASSSTTPDLFDHALIELERSKQGDLKFVKDYQLICRHETIGHSYESLRNAASLSQLLVQNAAHLPESDALFELTQRAFDAFAKGKASEVVLLKSLYLLLKDEGFPVRESWWPNLPTDLRASARALITQPAPGALSPKEQGACHEIRQLLEDWMRRHTDLTL